MKRYIAVFIITYLLLSASYCMAVDVNVEPLATPNAVVGAVGADDNSQTSQGIIPDLLGDDDGWIEDDYDENAEEPENATTIYDPIEPVNRLFFMFNDKLYDWILKPITDGYSWLMPYEIRNTFDNVFDNIGAPVRLVNTLLQGDFERSGIVAERFILNTTLGVLGIHDIADDLFQLKQQRADFGQTLGSWGVGFGPYVCWPLLGPSSVRDTVGIGVDSYFNPTGYVIEDWEVWTGYNVFQKTNTLSLNSGMIEDLRKLSLDPYVAARQAYFDYRQSRIQKSKSAVPQYSPQ